jgi:HAD superfamily hydrolase (TIGR01509 family)
MPLRGLFFDFDGLIVDTESPEVEVWREVFAENGAEFPDEYWINSIGRGADQIDEQPIDLLARLSGAERDWPLVNEERHRRVMERIRRQPVRPGILQLADEARAAGLHVAVVSSSHHDWVDVHLDRLGVLDRFDRTVCRDDAEQAKPFPHLYLKACELFGIEPQEAVTFEDSPNGIHAAKTAGVFVVAVPNPMTARLDLSHANARLESLRGVSLEDVKTLAQVQTRIECGGLPPLW